MLSPFDQGQIGELKLSAAQWRILRRCLEHNLNNAMSGLVLVDYHLTHGTVQPEDRRLIQVALDRVQALIATIAALEEEAGA